MAKYVRQDVVKENENATISKIRKSLQEYEQ